MNVETYLARLTPPHNDKPKFLKTVEVSLQPFIDAGNLLRDLSTYFDLDAAVGVQLDAVGEKANLSRNIEIPTPDPWFRFGDAKRGWGIGVWKQPYSTASYLDALGDEDYRRLIKARISALHWDGTAAQAKDIINSFFNPSGSSATTYIIDDHEQMDVFYAIAGKIPDVVTLEIFAGDYIPLRPAGVQVKKLVTSVDNAPVFGFGVNNSMIGGWGSGAWGVTPRKAIETKLLLS